MDDFGMLIGRTHGLRAMLSLGSIPSYQPVVVAGRRVQMGVAEQYLNDPDVGPAFQKMGGKTVPQRVRGDTLADPRPSSRGTTGRLKSADTHVTTRLLPGKQPQARPCPLPIGPKHLQKPRRQHRITISAALAVLDVKQHPSAVDCSNLETRHLADFARISIAVRSSDFRPR